MLKFRWTSKASSKLADELVCHGLIGNDASGRAEWAPASEPEHTNLHYFVEPELAQSF
jgi:hypothetical protein